MTEFELTFPREEQEFLKASYSNSEAILEYGSGGSTVFAACETKANVLSIESDKSWTQNLNELLQRRGVSRARASVRWVDIGPTKKWGYPVDHRRWQHYPDYVFTPWDVGFEPDVVLIDGRFRRACFAATLMLCVRETTVLFDDYSDRETYKQVEALAKPVEIVGRMARFEVSPKTRGHPDFAQMVRWFFKLN